MLANTFGALLWKDRNRGHGGGYDSRLSVWLLQASLRQRLSWGVQPPDEPHVNYSPTKASGERIRHLRRNEALENEAVLRNQMSLK